MADGLLNYYPSEKYIRKNWAPEQIGQGNIEPLAKAQKMAVAKGLLSPQLANAMLPIALVEGNGNYGIVDGRYGYPPNPKRDKMLADMGLRVIDYDGQTSNGGIPSVAAMVTSKPTKLPDFSTFDLYRMKNQGYWVPSGVPSENYYSIMARLMPVVLAEKAALYGENNAIERWNGKGKAVEDNGWDDEQKADSKYHKGKVEEMIRMLNHPLNADIKNAYQGLLKGK